MTMHKRTRVLTLDMFTCYLMRLYARPALDSAWRGFGGVSPTSSPATLKPLLNIHNATWTPKGSASHP